MIRSLLGALFLKPDQVAFSLFGSIFTYTIVIHHHLTVSEACEETDRKLSTAPGYFCLITCRNYIGQFKLITTHVGSA